MVAKGSLIKRSFRYEIINGVIDLSIWQLAQYIQTNESFFTLIKEEISDLQKKELEEKQEEAQRLFEEKQSLIEEEQRRLDEKRINRIKELKEKAIYYYQQGVEEESRINKQWFRKNYKVALWHYKKAYSFFIKIEDTDSNFDLQMNSLREAINRVEKKSR